MRSRVHQLRGQGGFTLIELLVVVLIIGLLATIMLPRFLGQRDASNHAAAQSNLRHAAEAAEAYYLQTESYAAVGALATSICQSEPGLTVAGFSACGTGTPDDPATPTTCGTPSRCVPGSNADPNVLWVAVSGSGKASTATLCNVSRGSKSFCLTLKGTASAVYSSGSDLSLAIIDPGGSTWAGTGSGGGGGGGGSSNTAPTNSAVPTVSGTAQASKTLTATSGTWNGSPTPTYSYQWQRCNAAGASCSNISAATASSYVLTNTDVGSTVRVTVTATNAAGSASANSAVTATVAADPCAGGSYCQAVTGTSGIKNYWRLSNSSTVQDIVSNVSFTYGGANVSNVAGVTSDGNGAVQFTNTYGFGSGAYITATPSVDFSGTKPWTIEVWWHNSTMDSTPYAALYGSYNGSGSTGCSSMSNSQPVCMTFSHNGIGTSMARGGYTSVGSMSASYWRYLAVTYDGSNLSLYGTTYIPGFNIPVAQSLSVAATQSLGANPITRFLQSASIQWDELALYNRALSVSEMQAHFDAR